jgi:hypothetical protein
MDAHTLLSNLRNRGIRLTGDGEKLTAEPASRLSDSDRVAIRQSKSDLLRILSKNAATSPPGKPDAVGSRQGVTPLPIVRPTVRAIIESTRDDRESLDTARMALALLARLKGYTLPSGRMAVIRDLAERMRGLADTTAILRALRDFERELIDLGGEYDAELADAMEIVQSTFPGARLVKFTQ